MSWLLFMDESGHDHKNLPYEVRGGIALHAGKVWPFVQAIQRLELDAFGGYLHQYRKELKGHKLLDKDRFKWAVQAPAMEAEERRKHCRGFLTKGLEKKAPTRPEFTAYGQACLEMARGAIQILRDHGAVLFAAAIPCAAHRPPDFALEDYLRKDQVFLLERFYYFLDEQQEHGLIVMDEVEKSDDRRFVRRMENYYQRTHTGRLRTKWVVPAPFFVNSEMAYPVQIADLVIYCVNWGFRVPGIGMNAAVRQEIADEFDPWLYELQFKGRGRRGEEVFQTYGIVYVPDPYNSRA